MEEHTKNIYIGYDDPCPIFLRSNARPEFPVIAKIPLFWRGGDQRLVAEQQPVGLLFAAFQRPNSGIPTT
jgi:hypothetical protein